MAPYGTGSFEVMLDFDAIKQMTTNQHMESVNDETPSERFGETPDVINSPEAPIDCGQTVGGPGGTVIVGFMSTY